MISKIRVVAERIHAARKRSACGTAISEFVIRFASWHRFIGLLGATAAFVLPTDGYTLGLDDAVKSQLEFQTVACEELLDNRQGGTRSLTGELKRICNKGNPAGGATDSTSTGGGAATPTSVPSIVQQRLRGARSKGKQPAEKVTAASADAVVQFGQRGNLFILAEDQKLDRNETALEDGFKSKIRSVTAGVDVGITKNLIAGVAFDASWQNLTFNGGGHADIQSYGGVGYGAFLPTDRLSAQFYGGYDHQSFDRQRTATFTQKQCDRNEEGVCDPNGSLLVASTPGSPAANYGANAYKAGILVAYELPIANVTISPFAAVDWRHTQFNTFSETGPTGLELTFHRDKITLLQSNLGVRASVAWRVGSWTFVPQASAGWKHEFENDQRNVEVSFVDDTRSKRFTYQTNAPARNWGEINAGVIAVLPNGIQASGNYRTIVGNSLFGSRAVMASLRIPF